MQRYIGLDVHAASTTFAVIGESGKRLGTHVVETNGQALVEQLKTIPGKRHVCLEEGTQSTWLYEILSPHAEEVLVVMVPESRGQKNDAKDAFTLAEQLRTGAIKKHVFKEVGEYGTLRELGRTHTMVVQDVVRVQNRIKALFRSRGIAVVGKSVYSEKGREACLKKLPDREPWGGDDVVRAVRRGGSDPAAGGEGPRDRGAPTPDEPCARVVPGAGSDPGGAVDADRGVAGAVPDQAAVLVVLWARDRDALVVGLGPETGRRLGAGRGAADARPEPESQSHAEVALQGRGHDRDHAARGRAPASGLPAADRGGHEAEPGEADDRPQARCDRSFDVEEQGEVRPDEASQARLKTRLTCGHVDPQEGYDRWHSTWRRARFEGEHPLLVWPGSNHPEVPRLGYAPSEYQKKPWSEEAQIEGWFPLSCARTHVLRSSSRMPA